MWGRQDSNRNVLLSEGVNQSPPLTYEECPSCYLRFCLICRLSFSCTTGKILCFLWSAVGDVLTSFSRSLSNQGGVPQGLLNDSGSNNSVSNIHFVH